MAQPYERHPPLKVKIVSVKKITKVISWLFGDGTATPKTTYQNTVAVISDGKQIKKMFMFEDLASQVEEGQSLIIRNYSLTTGTTQSVLCRKSTSVFVCAPVVVPLALQEEARALLCPQSAFCSLKEVQTVAAPLITIRGHINDIDKIKRFLPEVGQPMPMRSIIMKDEESEVKVMLWREINLAPIVDGMFVEVTHLRPTTSSTFGFALHSTNDTDINLLNKDMTITVEGYQTTPDKIAILDDKFIKHVVPAALYGGIFEMPPQFFGKISLKYTDGIISGMEKFSVKE